MAEVTFIAPVAKIEGKLNQKERKIYIKFDCYVRAKVWRELV